jgi:hypothetical protein
MNDYKRNDPKGWCGDPKRGAAMGRATVKGEPTSYDGRLSLRRVRLDNGGYDPNGTYFGTGVPLYWCSNEEGTVDFMIRAKDRTDALWHVAQWYPKAKVRK